MGEQLEIPFEKQIVEYNGGRTSNQNDDPDEDDDYIGAVIRMRENAIIRYA